MNNSLSSSTRIWTITMVILFLTVSMYMYKSSSMGNNNSACSISSKFNSELAENMTVEHDTEENDSAENVQIDYIVNPYHSPFPSVPNESGQPPSYISYNGMNVPPTAKTGVVRAEPVLRNFESRKDSVHLKKFEGEYYESRMKELRKDLYVTNKNLAHAGQGSNLNSGILDYREYMDAIRPKSTGDIKRGEMLVTDGSINHTESEIRLGNIDTNREDTYKITGYVDQNKKDSKADIENLISNHDNFVANNNQANLLAPLPDGISFL
jgi:hypothetical protein